MVDKHGAMKILFYLTAFLVVERPQVPTFLESSPDIGQGQKQIPGHAFLPGNFNKLPHPSQPDGLGFQLLITAGVQMPATGPGAAWAQLLGRRRLARTLHVRERGHPC